jgi:predicted enzyme related to lactoylglutathione lyase
LALLTGIDTAAPEHRGSSNPAKEHTMGHSQILYVSNPAESGAFYGRLLGREPVDASPNFVMFALADQLMLGLWAKGDVQPAASAPGGSEMCFSLADAVAVDACHARWREQGAAILQAPTDMDFGHTFTAADPDGHRLRVFAPHPGQA